MGGTRASNCDSLVRLCVVSENAEMRVRRRWDVWRIDVPCVCCDLCGRRVHLLRARVLFGWMIVVAAISVILSPHQTRHDGRERVSNLSSEFLGHCTPRIGNRQFGGRAAWICR